MNTITINEKELNIKDYHCIACVGDFNRTLYDEYLKKSENKLWLYVFVTETCNASCEFCVNNCSEPIQTVADPTAFKATLSLIKDKISGISFTGGEPLLYPELLDELIGIADNVMESKVEIDVVTNGSNLHALYNLKNLRLLTTIHLSRHSVDDEQNQYIMKSTKVPARSEIQQFVDKLEDPGAVVFNCILQKGGVDNCEKIAEYLNMAIEIGVRNNSFITMIRANQYAVEHYLSAMAFPFHSDFGITGWNNSHISQFKIWNRHKDHNYCRCLSGDYINPNGNTRFYMRCPDAVIEPCYCRQLVYTADNKLQDGFGNNRKMIINVAEM